MLSIRFRRLIHWTAKQRSVLCHSRENTCTALNSSGSMLSIGAFDAAWLQLLGHKDPIHGPIAGRLDTGCSSYVLSCFQFNIIPLWNVWHSGNGLIFFAQVDPIMIPCQNSMSVTHYLTNVCRSSVRVSTHYNLWLQEWIMK